MVFIMHCYKNNFLIFLMKVVQKLAIESKTFIWNDQYIHFLGLSTRSFFLKA